MKAALALAERTSSEVFCAICGSHISTNSKAMNPCSMCLHKISGSGGARLSTESRSIGSPDFSRNAKKTCLSRIALLHSGVMDETLVQKIDLFAQARW
jgi:hypothetical protein